MVARRTREELEPVITWPQAQAALARIRRLRHAAHDRDLAFLATELVDDQDVEAVLRHLATRPLASIAQDELAPREVLVEYLWQQAQRRHDQQTLAILNTGRRTRAGDQHFGPRLSRLHRNGRHNLLVRLTEKLDPYQTGPAPTRRDTAAVDAATGWRAQHRAELHDVAGTLLDHQATLLAAVTDDDRAALDEALGALAAAVVEDQPTTAFLGALRYTVFLVRDAVLPDPVLRDAVATGQRLVDQYAIATTGPVRTTGDAPGTS